ncbi:hypothetical protein DIREPILLOW8_206 [Vibrio phage Direpillow8]|nr:hypothetical protein DIREPILLOW8_206 [Vibrio phage Direpillow8]
MGWVRNLGANAIYGVFKRYMGLYGGLGAKQTGFKDFGGFGQKFGKTN